MKQIRFFVESINGYVGCPKCEDAYSLAEPIPRFCKSCKAVLWGSVE